MFPKGCGWYLMLFRNYCLCFSWIGTYPINTNKGKLVDNGMKRVGTLGERQNQSCESVWIDFMSAAAAIEYYDRCRILTNNQVKESENRSIP